jgi:hypothetical protein
MTFYAGDEYADDDCTSGPYDPELHDPDFDAERQAIEDEYDREQSR